MQLKFFLHLYDLEMRNLLEALKGSLNYSQHRCKIDVHTFKVGLNFCLPGGQFVSAAE